MWQKSKLIPVLNKPISHAGVWEGSIAPLILNVVGANLCVRHLLGVHGKGFRRSGGVAGMEAYTVQSINII